MFGQVTVVGILTFMRRKNSILSVYEPENAEFLDIFILMSSKISCLAELSMKKVLQPLGLAITEMGLI